MSLVETTPDSGPVYLDYHATTPIDSRVLAEVIHFSAVDFGNPSSIDHNHGDRAESTVARATTSVRHLVGAGDARVVFTSGATESINLALRGFVSALRQSGARRIRIGLSAVEHAAVQETCRFLGKIPGVELVTIGVDYHGNINLDEVRNSLSTGLDLLCVMAANNVVGNIYPLSEIGSLARAAGVHLFTDATQAIGQVEFSFDDWHISAMAFSAHKMYGPKGVGALVFSPAFPIDPLWTGGKQQFGLRPGTLNVPGIAGLGAACRFRRSEMVNDGIRVQALRDYLTKLLMNRLSDLVVFGSAPRLPGNLSCSVPGVPNKAVVARVRDRLSIATGAACSSGLETQSHVLQAMGVPDHIADGHLRIGLGKFTTTEEIEIAAEAISEAVRQTQQVMSSAC